MPRSAIHFLLSILLLAWQPMARLRGRQAAWLVAMFLVLQAFAAAQHDHVRETFFLQYQVSDPMDVASTSPALFFTRLSAHFCAPMFVFLTGLSAWLYANPPGGRRDATGFLVKRGLLLIALEIVVINFAWTGTFAPAVLYLQVMWAIGLAMLALALLHRLPLAVLAAAGLLIVGGHNALAGLSFEPGSFAAHAWTVLEQRGYLADEPVRVKISNPVLAWIGVILLGYACGPLFARTLGAAPRRAGAGWRSPAWPASACCSCCGSRTCMASRSPGRCIRNPCRA
ncbi:DUF1624 domain-containing protein [Massilia niabensis]|uniref:DUF1624 domain-containing protein n=1 Tax=Massilia niabensis TaxID=544910 RepID=A0ABW0LAM6_9BURK